MQIPQLSKNWTDQVLFPTREEKISQAGPATIRSRSFPDPDRGIFYCRECILGSFLPKLYSYTPQTEGIFPIFGFEYIRRARGSFSVIDFHPPNRKNNAILPEFGSYPPPSLRSRPVHGPKRPGTWYT